MIRFIHCFRRRPELSAKEFRALWENPEFDRLIERMASAVGAVRWTRNATLVVGANALIQQHRGTDEPFDGVLEYFLEGAAHFADLVADPAFQELDAEMRAYQERFADHSRSAAFFTEGR